MKYILVTAIDQEKVTMNIQNKLMFNKPKTVIIYIFIFIPLFVKDSAKKFTYSILSQKATYFVLVCL